MRDYTIHYLYGGAGAEYNDVMYTVYDIIIVTVQPLYYLCLYVPFEEVIQLAYSPLVAPSRQPIEEVSRVDENISVRDDPVFQVLLDYSISINQSIKFLLE